MARPPLRLNLNKVANRDAGSRAAAAAHRIGRVCPPVGRHVATTVEILALRKRSSPCPSLSLTYSLFFFPTLFRFLSHLQRFVRHVGVPSNRSALDLTFGNQFFTMLPHIIPSAASIFPQSQRATGIYARNAFHQKVGIDIATVNIQMLITHAIKRDKTRG